MINWKVTKWKKKRLIKRSGSNKQHQVKRNTKKSKQGKRLKQRRSDSTSIGKYLLRECSVLFILEIQTLYLSGIIIGKLYLKKYKKHIAFNLDMILVES